MEFGPILVLSVLVVLSREIQGSLEVTTSTTACTGSSSRELDWCEVGRSKAEDVVRLEDLEPPSRLAVSTELGEVGLLENLADPMTRDVSPYNFEIQRKIVSCASSLNP